MSAYHMVDRAVEAMKLGAHDYLIKPFHLADMIATLRRAGEMLALRVRVRDDVETARGRYDFGKVVTQNEATRCMLEVAHKDCGIRSHHHSHPGREWHGQGRVRQGDSQCEPAGVDAAAGIELRFPARRSAGKRIVRF
jgi:YesN/AraC family two-component response regulator